MARSKLPRPIVTCRKSKMRGGRPSRIVGHIIYNSVHCHISRHAVFSVKLRQLLAGKRPLILWKLRLRLWRQHGRGRLRLYVGGLHQLEQKLQMGNFIPQLVQGQVLTNPHLRYGGLQHFMIEVICHLSCFESKSAVVSSSCNHLFARHVCTLKPRKDFFLPLIMAFLTPAMPCCAPGRMRGRRSANR